MSAKREWVRPSGCECDASQPAKYRCTAQWMRCRARIAYTMKQRDDRRKKARL